MLKIIETAENDLTIMGDEKVMEAVEGDDLKNVKVPKVVTADDLNKAYNNATSEGAKNDDGTSVITRRKYYAACKQRYIEQHKAHLEAQEQRKKERQG